MDFSRDFTIAECWSDNGEGWHQHLRVQLSELEISDWVELNSLPQIDISSLQEDSRKRNL